MDNGTSWKLVVAEAVLDIRCRGEALSFVALLSQLRQRGRRHPEQSAAAEEALDVLLKTQDMGEVGDVSDAF